MKKRIFKSIFFLILGIGILIGYSILYEKTGWGIPCMIHEITGYYCPGCGLTRMLFALMHLDIKAAFGYNQFMFIFLPFLLFYFGYQIYCYIVGKKDKLFSKIPDAVYIVLLIIVIAWGVIRNLSFFPFLRP